MGYLPDSSGALYLHCLVDITMQPYAAFSPSLTDGETFLSPLSPSLLSRLSTDLIGQAPLCLSLATFSPDAFDRTDFDRLHIPCPSHLGKAVIKRQAEYLAARVCARDALDRMQVKGMPWVPENDRCPRWPSPMVGALTHSQGIAGAAVANGEHIAGVGIDIERWIDKDRSERLAQAILCEDELMTWQGITSTTEQAAWLTRIFSAKESLYKALYPLVGRSFYFHDASSAFDPDDTGQLRLTLRLTLNDSYPSGFSCMARIVNDDTCVISLVAV